MDNNVLMAIISLLGSIVGTFGGIMAANRLTNYRLEELEKKVEKHNNVVERMYSLETRVAVDEEELEHLKAYHK